MPLHDDQSLTNARAAALDNVTRTVPGSVRAWQIEIAAFHASKVRSVGIIGAGVMGTAIAVVHAQQGLPVVICDADEAALAKVHGNVEKLLSESGIAAELRLSQVRRLIQPTGRLSALARCDLVLESIAETLSLKQQLYAQLQPHLGPRTIVASNTSTIPIARLAAAMKAPNRFCGMHFFHPVGRRPLVEVVRGPETDPRTIAVAAAHIRAIHFRPIIVNDGPGFVVNRLLFPQLTQALQMLCEGVAVEEIERAATDFGMAMGPLQLMDEIGLDTTLQAGWVLAAAFPDRIIASPLLVSMVKARQLGCKSGVGFFIHGDRDEPNGARRVNPALGKRIAHWARPTHGGEPASQSIADRLLLPMVLEAARILEENRSLSPADIDQGAVLGLGFPASRGGLLKWADTLGGAEILRRLQTLGDGPCYQPPAVLTDLARRGGTFYPRNSQE